MKTIHDPRYVAMIEHLRVRRLELGLTQAELARLMGASRLLIVRTEQCERRLDLLELLRWLDALDLRLSAVLKAIQHGPI